MNQINFTYSLKISQVRICIKTQSSMNEQMSESITN